jgi:isopentenyl-diphosphate Delta-isomerase
MSSLSQRKADHITHSLNPDVQMDVSNGFDTIYLRPEALPDLDFEDLDLTTSFLGHKFSYPFLIASMTGGVEKGKIINKNLAIAAQKLNIGMGLGSMRVILKDPAQLETFVVAREMAPDIFLAGNIGLAQLLEVNLTQLKTVLNQTGVNALYLHLNVLQELIQPEGDRRFKGAEKRIHELVELLEIPVLIKEVGCGLDGQTALRLKKLGISAIDVAGAGGTSWAAIEAYRHSSPNKIQDLLAQFKNWGLSTADSLVSVKQAVGEEFPVIASGGIRDGLTAAKALVMGASLISSASILLEPALQSPEAVEEVLVEFIDSLKITMMITGAGDLGALKKVQYRCES